ncbi:protein SIEVE ELEMENT OCCLUSION B-like [Prosopis cineraria]|uniref:protein SIEVE ELEMENT OCCLUSION B-like n=1 Tax=Prosopis cineraria TaxID=364024 RepID=UPI00240FCD4B|nr:protein SIEVE ELEMENT OCCLUSION B-like [Prosopis cineraria]
MASASSTTSPLRMTMMPDPNMKPLTLDDKQILGLVYDCYVVNKPGETFDPEALFSVVSDIFIRSFRTADPSIKYDPLEQVDKTYLANLEPPTDLLKRFACQMRETQHHEYHTNAHQTTMAILKALESYSWCAKAVTALAAFALEYGIFWHLYDQRLQRQDSLGNSLAVLSHVHHAALNQRDISDYNVVVKHVFVTVEHIVRLERIMKTYDGKNIPTLEKAMHEFPAFVYWTVLTIVILATHINILFGYPMGKYKLSDIGSKISTIDIKLKDYLTQIDMQKAFIDDYRSRDRVGFQTPTEIVQVLKCLLFPRDLENPHVYDGSTGSMVSIEVFRMNHVLLFVSGLYSIDDETNLLREIHKGLKQSDPRVVKGFKKDEFKILWAPIVDEEEQDHRTLTSSSSSMIMRRQQFEEMKRKMNWYVVDYTIIPPICKRLIRDRLKYQNNPIVPVFNPQGRLTNDDALHMLFTWELLAFPWRKGDDLALTQKWNWIWTDMKKSNPQINNWIKDDAYIIIYGRTEADWYDDQWLKKMPEALERIKADEIIRRFDIRINHSHHGKGDKERHTVSKFWSYIESTFDSMKRMKKTTEDDVDGDTFNQVKSFLGLRQEHSGWVILSKGPNIKLLGRGNLFYQTLHEFDSWKQNIEQDSGFDVSLKNYYESLLSKLPHHAAHCRQMVLKNYLSNIYDPVYCPDCGLQMNLRLAEYTCCHGHQDDDQVNNIADTGGGDVEIMR